MAKTNIRPYLYAAFGADVVDPTTYRWTDLTDDLRDTGGDAFGTRRGRQDVTQRMDSGTAHFLLDNRRLRYEQLNTLSPYFPNVIPEVPIRFGYEHPWLPGLFPQGDMRTDITQRPGVQILSATATYLPPPWDTAQGSMLLTATMASAPAYDFGPIAIPNAGGKVLVVTLRVQSDNANPGDTAHLDVAAYGAEDAYYLTFLDAVTSPDVHIDLTGSPTRLSVMFAPLPAGTNGLRVSLTGPGSSVGTVLKVSSLVLDYTTLDSMVDEFFGTADSWLCEGDLGDSVCTLSATGPFKTLGLQTLNSPFYGDWIRANVPSIAKWYRLNEMPADPSGIPYMAFTDEISGVADASIAHYVDPRIGAPAAVVTTNEVGTTDSFVGAGPLPGVAGMSPLDNDFAFSLVGASSKDYGCIELPRSARPVGHQFTYILGVRSPNGVVPKANSIGLNSQDGTTRQGYRLLTIDWDDTSTGHSRMRVMLDLGREDITDPRYGGGRVIVNLYDDPTFLHSATTVIHDQNIVVDQLWHQVVVVYNQNPLASIVLPGTTRIFVDGIESYLTTAEFGAALNWSGISAIAPHMFLGDPWPWARKDDPNVPGTYDFLADYDPKVEIDEFIKLDYAMTPTAIMDLWLASRVEYDPEPSVSRADKTLTLGGWPTQYRSLDTTKGTTVKSLRYPLSEVKSLSYLQTLEDTEQGMLLSLKGGAVSLIDHLTLVSRTSRFQLPFYTFGNGNGEIPFEKYATSNNEDILYTQATVTIEDGEPQSSDSALEQRYYIRNLPLDGLLLDNPDQAKWIANWLSTIYSVVGTKLKSITVNPYLNAGVLDAVQNIEIGDAVTVHLRPPGVEYAFPLLITGGSPGYLGGDWLGENYLGIGGSSGPPVVSYDHNAFFTITAQVQSINHTGSRKHARVTYDLDSTFARKWMEFGDPFDSYPMAL